VSRRSPNNERYQKFTEPKGQTRKSAAAAKPKRDGNVPTKSKTATRGRARSLPKAPARSTYNEPTTPEYRKWRRIWWWSLGAGVAFVTASLLLQYVIRAQGAFRGVSIVLIAASYSALIVAFFVDYRKLRPMRKDFLDSAKTGKADKGGKAAKAAASSDAADTAADSDSDTAAGTASAADTSK
jgi:hypothetical protein